MTDTLTIENPTMPKAEDVSGIRMSDLLAGQPVTPYYDEDGVTLYCGDNRRILPLLGNFDVLLTDPPYGIGKIMQGGTWGNKFKGAYEAWDAAPPPRWMFGYLMEITKHQIIWGGNYYELPPQRGWLVWEKPKMPTMGDAELAWTSLDQPPKSYNENRSPDGDRDHPTQKPASLMKWCLQQVPAAGSVLDPWAGSGTTLLAARELGRRCVGIEINEQYCKAAVRRLSQRLLWPANDKSSHAGAVTHK